MRTNLYKTKTGGSGPHAPCGAAPRRQRLKRIIALAFAICCGAQMAQAYNFSANVYGQTLYFNIIDPNNRKVEVTYPGNAPNFLNVEIGWYGFAKPTGVLTIPNEVQYSGNTYTVTRIGDFAFGSCSDVSIVNIFQGVKEIGIRAFQGCSGLTSVAIPNTVNSIKSSAFMSCNSLEQVHITDINKWCQIDFENALSNPLNSAASINTLYLGSNRVTDLSSIGNSTVIKKYAFIGCTSLNTANIPSGVTTIGEEAFYGCSNLTSASIPSSVTRIESDAFYICLNLTSVKITDLNKWCRIDFVGPDANPLKYAKKLYLNGSQVTSLSSSNMGNLTAIKPYTFYNCTGITSLTIPSGVTSIGTSAFYGTGITSLSIPSGVTSIGDGAFNGCSSLEQVHIHSNAVASATYTDSKNFGTIFGSQAWQYTIGNSVTAIGAYAFHGCSGMKLISIGNGVTSIGDNAFGRSTWGGDVFGCNSLKHVHISDLDKWCQIDFAGFYSNPLVFSHRLVHGGNVVTDLSGINSTTTIKAYAFCGLTDLTSVSIPSCVQTIGMDAFKLCTGITNLTIPANVTNIGDGAFIGCSSLEQVYIYSDAVASATYTSSKNFGTIFGDQVELYRIRGTVTAIGAYAFHGCSGMKTIIIDNGNGNLTSIGAYAFGGNGGGCNSLRAVYIADLNKWCQIDFAGFCSNPLSFAHHLYLNSEKVTDLSGINSTTTIKAYAFCGLTDLTSVSIPSCVRIIKDYAFNGCTGITSLDIPSGVTTIENGAFYGCNNLASVILNSNIVVASNSYTSIYNFRTIFGNQVKHYTIGANVAAIGKYAFNGCSGIEEMTVNATTPPTFSDTYTTLSGVSRSIGLYVPSQSVQQYKNALGWKEFYHIGLSPKNMPYVEDFSTTSLPTGWSRFTGELQWDDATGTGTANLTEASSWYFGEKSGIFGESHAYTRLGGSSTETYHKWLVSPSIVIDDVDNAFLQFSIALARWNGTQQPVIPGKQDNQGVHVLITDDFGTTWHKLLTFDNQGGGLPFDEIPVSGHVRTINLGDFKGKTVMMAIYGYSTGENQGYNCLHIDSFRLQTRDLAGAPNSVAVSEVAGKWAKVQWQPSSSLQREWDVWVTDGNEGPSDAFDFQPNYGILLHPYVFNNEFVVEGLTPNKEYRVWVRYNDGHVKSPWTSSAQFLTTPMCNPPANVQVETTTTTIFVSWEPGQANQTRWQVSIIGSDVLDYQTNETSILIDAHEMFLPGESFSVVVTGYCKDGDGDVESEEINATMQPLPSLTLNEVNRYSSRVIIDGSETGSQDGSQTQFVIPASMLQAMHHSTIKEMTFYGDHDQAGWGNNVEFDVYMKEVDIEDFSDYCDEDFYSWNNLDNVYSGGLRITDGQMTIEVSSHYGGFEYGVGNLLVGIKQGTQGTSCQAAWRSAASGQTAMYYKSSAEMYLCANELPMVTFNYEPDPYQPPTNLEAAFVSPNEVYYSWTPRPGQTATIIEIANDASFISLISSTNSTDTDCTATLGTSLQPATTYYVRAKAIFKDDNESEWSATIELVVPGICDAPTGLAASNVGPFSANLRWTGDADGYEVEYDRLVGEVLSTTWEQDFEIIASGNLPSGWSTITPPTVNSQKWRVVNATKNQMANGGRGGAIISAKQANAATDDYLLIPVSDLRGRLSFYAKFRNQTGPGTGVVAIYYTKKKTNPQPTDLTPIEAKTITDTYTEYVIDLGHLQGGGYIAFRHYAPSNANVYAICLDDIEMENYGPQYGAWVSGGITDWNGTTIEGLTPDNTYRARVRALCDGSYSGHSAWTSATVFSTVKNIEFYDSDVEALCVAVWDTDDDGKLSYAEAAAVTSLGEVFKGKTNVDTFNELQYFTGLSAIGDYAFYNCTNLSGVLLPPQITSIGEYAFGYCKGMTGITLPENVNTIDMCAFRGSGLYAIDLPNSVTSISNLAFADCDNLEAVYLPATVINMDSNPFAYCANLEAILVSPANSVFDSRDNCNAIVHTETNKLVSGCKSTAIPETVTTIGHLAFGGSTGLIALTIPEAVTRIDDAAFCNCSNLANLTVMATEPPTLGTLVFDGVAEGCWFAVPCEHLAAYRAHEQWGLLNIGNDCDYRFVTDGNWNDANNWLYGELPGEDDDVTIEANCLLDTDVTVASINFLNTGANIPNNGALEIDGCTLTVTNTIANSDANRLVLNDGAQLKHNNIGVRATVYKSITGYGAANVNKSTGWHFIASPIYGGVYANRVDNLIANPAENYDLYAFVPEWEKEWDNLKDNYNSGYVNSMQGYLYANLNNVSLGFKGTLMKSNAKLNMSINETDPETGEAMDYSEYSFGAWRLLGNSFVCDAYITDASDEGIAYYVMNEEGDGYIPAEGAIAPMQGFFVEVPTKTESYSFYLSREAPTGGRAATLNANLSKAKATRDGVSAGSKTVIDRAIVHFGEGSTLEKLTFRDDNTRLYIPQDGTDYAVVKAGTMGELPVNFKAETNGRYTLDFTNEEVAFSYLRLIDNMTGTETDLLQQPYYSFDARTTDYASRFRLQFATGTSENAEGSTFGFVNASGNFTVFGIEGEATLQVIDVTGRVLSSETFSGSYERKLDVSPGVYLMRLINGADVKTQKIVIE